MATTWPCDNAIDCPCADGNPAQNYSSENPDPFTFFARRFFPNPIDLADPNQVFISTSCGQTCTSSVSQADADACALRAAVQCVQPPGPPAPDDPVLFGNRATSCQAACPEGPPFILSIPAGTYLARTQELADLIAQSFCQADVIQFRHCDMPPMPPPQGVCPHITTQTTSPINANDGDNVTMTVNYTYNSAMMLMFVWFKDGVPTYATPSSTLTLNAVGPSDAGQYILGIYASGCFPVFSSPIVLNVTSACPPEVGPDAPMTLDIEHPVEWETWTINNGEFGALVSSDGGCNPTFEYFYKSPTGLDHAPGIYGERYVSGFFDSSTGCPGITPVSGTFAIFELVNEKYNIDAPAACNYLDINNGVARDMPGDPPPVNSYGGGLVTACRATLAEIQNDLTAFWAGKVIAPNPYPPDQLLSFPHNNDGGMFTVYTNIDPPLILSPLVFKILQIDGQIPQPRKLKIDSFGAIAAQFSDPAIAANWNGAIDTRTAYTSSLLQWNATPSGGFGGAQLDWINNHPGSANGFGWKLQIFGAGSVLVWEGLKAIDSTSEGIYYKTASTPVGPLCLSVSDNSDTAWSPP